MAKRRTRWESAHNRYQQQTHFSSLDGLRAAAVLAVVWHHATGRDGLLGRGFHGVDLFFAISGFLITTLLLREHASLGRVDIRAFLVRRALRIFPLYYVVLGAYVVGWWAALRGTAVGDEFVSHLPAFATYTSNWFVHIEAGRSILFYHSWSLATEEQFYLVWPALLMLLLPRRAGVLRAACLIGLVALADLTVPLWTGGPSLTRTVVSSVATPICLGALLALALHTRKGFGHLAPLLHHWSAPVVATAAVASALLLDAPEPWLSIALTGLVGAICVRDDHCLRPVLTAKPVAYVGRVSYGVYLMHPLALGIVAVLVTPGYLFPATLVAALGMAAVSYRYLESPLLRLKQRWAPSRPNRSAAHVPEPLAP